mmetsp:Transcript_65681/g.137310  ORF Transcript_65681/g.137310 Transcript_65681/m.137310 type:complete len:209 (+) Transcript_65681:392-1018(+)
MTSFSFSAAPAIFCSWATSSSSFFKLVFKPSTSLSRAESSLMVLSSSSWRATIRAFWNRMVVEFNASVDGPACSLAATAPGPIMDPLGGRPRLLGGREEEEAGVAAATAATTDEAEAAAAAATAAAAASVSSRAASTESPCGAKAWAEATADVGLDKIASAAPAASDNAAPFRASNERSSASSSRSRCSKWDRASVGKHDMRKNTDKI